MSDKSYQIKENNQVMIQGGEKKVMKKILSVALSTAMAFSMFASVAFGDDALNTQQKYDVLKEAKIFSGYPDGSAGLDKEMTRAEFAKVLVGIMGLEPIQGKASFKDKNYKASKWPAPYVEAVYSAGLMQGKNTTKMIFDFNGKITVQEMAKVLVVAQKLDIPTETNNNASDWAKGYVQAAINAGLVDAKANPKANATRAQLVEVAYDIYLSQQKPKVVSYDVTENGKVVTFKLANNESVKVTLEKALEANKATEVKFTHNNYEYTESVTWVVTTASKVESASASNLKEIVVVFDGTVDKETAEEKANYSLKSGKAIKSVSLADDNKTATVTVEGTLANNKKESLSVANIKAGTTVVNTKNVEFTVVDNQIPEVTAVQSLGTKSVKVVFSEPVNDLKQSNFTLDGKQYFGKLTIGANNRSVILTPFNSSALAVGEHTLVVTGVKDFANFVSLTSSNDFTVVEDKEAPTITEAKATLETLTLTFSEDVDVDTISASKVYWKSGNDKKAALSFEAVADNKYKFNFGAGDRSLPTGAVTIYVEGVKDYSGNEIAKDTTVVVTPEIDQVRPEVTRVTAVNSTQIKINLSKEILRSSAQDVKNYVVLDGDNKNVSVRSADLDPTDKTGKTILVNLYSNLSTGNNTITIKNLKDATKLQNTMLDYSGTISVGDTKAPELDSVVVNTNDRRVVLHFNEKMDPETIADYSNYLVTIDNRQQGLTPDIADITVLQDGSVAVITFAETLNGKNVRLASGQGGTSTTHISKIHVLGVKDLAGNLLKEFTEANGSNVKDITTTTVIGLGNIEDSGKPAKLVDRKTVQVKFTAGIQHANSGAFSFLVNGVEQVGSVDVNGTSVVTVHLNNAIDSDAAGLDLNVDLSRLETVAGERAGSSVSKITSANILDKVKPQVINDSNVPYPVSGNQIRVSYSESLVLSSPLATTDLKITRVSDNKVLDPATDYDLTLEAAANGKANSVLVITLKDDASRTVETAYRVTVDGAKYIKDTAGNVIDNSDRESAKIIGSAAPTVTAVAATYGNNDGKITGVDTSMEYKLSTETSYRAVTGNEITGLAPGTYHVRKAANTTTGAPAGAVATVVVAQGAPDANQSIQAAKDALAAADLKIADADAATTTVTLPASGIHGTSISWKVTANTGALVEGVNNVVNSVNTAARPATGSATAEVTATISKADGTAQTKVFVITVPASGDITVAVK